jgi:hypothetical protein
VLRLAEPLYQLQMLVYQYAGAPLPDPQVQDGALLAELAAHLRRISPSALTDHFAARLARCEQGPPAVVVCDDMRGADAEALAGLGFVFVHVQAPASMRAERRRRRGDLTAVDESHPNEAAVASDSTCLIVNDGTLAELELHARALAEELMR